jgi:glutaredoxin
VAAAGFTRGPHADMALVTLYTKPGCCLCDEAKEALERVRARHPFDLSEVDVAADPALLDHYGERLPVVAVDGVETFDYSVDEAALERLVAGDPAPAR